jgi:hypothetical protein
MRCRYSAARAIERRLARLGVVDKSLFKAVACANLAAAAGAFMPDSVAFA